jgi:hypothetical protein
LVTIGSDNSATKLADFTALSTQLAKATPSSTVMSAYQPANTAAQACPAVGTNWAASSNLPPIVNPDTCNCMVSSAACVPKTTLSSNRTQEIFDYICGADASACAGITANATTGKYGAYSMCGDYPKLVWAVNAYYTNQKKAASACSFNGDASVVSASPASSCSAVLSAAGSSGTGTVTVLPTAGGGSGSSGSGTSSGGGSSASTSKSAVGLVTVPRFDTGMLQIGGYIVSMVLVGATMILL